LKYTLGLIIGITLGTISIATLMVQQAEAVTIPILAKKEAPSAVVGDNIYIAWWTNKTGNDEVIFRVSNDAGATFGDKINLSNTTITNSQNALISADSSNVVVTWWERNQTSEEPAVRISTDNGVTFGPILKLASNSTIGSSRTSGNNDDDVQTSAALATSTTSNNAIKVSMISSGDEGYQYQPETEQANIGDTVIWTNDNDALHTVTSGSGTDENMGAEFDSGMMAIGKTFEHTFTTAGEYPYFCTIHPDMIGKVIVS
jgi:plastocyanin